MTQVKTRSQAAVCGEITEALISGNPKVDWERVEQERVGEIEQVEAYELKLEKYQQKLEKRLRKDIQVFPSHKQIRDPSIDQDDKISQSTCLANFNPDDGFTINWDYSLNLPKPDFPQGTAIQLIYGLYNSKSGLPIIAPHQVQPQPIQFTNHPNFSQVIFNEGHHVRALNKLFKLDQDAMLIIEFQKVIPKKQQNRVAFDEKVSYRENSDELHTGYLLSRYSQEQDEMLQQALIEKKMRKLARNKEQYIVQSYAWTFIDIMDLHGRLKEGRLRLKLFQPPIVLNLDTEIIKNLRTLEGDSGLWIRIQSDSKCISQGNEQLYCDPSFFHLYSLPELHTLSKPQSLLCKPRKDPNYICSGLSIHIHYAKGFRHLRHVRIAACLQQNRDILAQSGGQLCFFASKGIQYPPYEQIKKAVNSKKEIENELKEAIEYYQDEEMTLRFDEKRTWVNDLYEEYWKNGQQDIYLVLQYLQRKPTVAKPTIDSVISRKLLEQEYDLIGYTSFKLTHDYTGFIKYGTFTLQLYQGPPILVQDLRNDKMIEGLKMKITLEQPQSDFDFYRQISL
ncbi:hypothetical protein FGO68_gene7627 [Halteria grandinella]|uniref:Uncharacterized protein n=1 Tax=Halteria grandinella TaxID=5974 RepID=A0A8J8NVY5_HALGN|nr:hypothetical protein FGO68_gene7627 [Halteria grandinella]